MEVFQLLKLRKIISTPSPKCTEVLTNLLCVMFALAKQANCPEMLFVHGLVFIVSDSEVYFFSCLPTCS